MTLRDYFAAQACSRAAEVICDLMTEGKPRASVLMEAELHARSAYIVADAMIKAREGAQ